jgi:hypothetical protein
VRKRGVASMAGEENEKENGEKDKEVIRQGLCSRHDVRNVTKPCRRQALREFQEVVQSEGEK